jgi:hypothetical protein
MPNRVWQFERPCPCDRVRWCARKDGLPMKKSENADKPDIGHRVCAARQRPLAPVG